jgi:hypothetical protein
MNLRNDWTVIAPIMGTFIPITNDITEGYILKLTREFAWNSPFWGIVYAAVLTLGLGASLLVSLRRKDLLRALVVVIASVASFILTILEKGLGAMWWSLLSEGLPFGLGYVILLAMAVIMMGGFFYLHYTMVVLPSRIRRERRTLNPGFL